MDDESLEIKNRDEKAFSFLGICLGSNNANEQVLKSLLVFENGEPYLSPFVLTYGFMAAIKKNKQEYIPMLFDYFINTNVQSDANYSYSNIIFNAASESNDIDLMNKLDKQFNIIRNSLKEQPNSQLYVDGSNYAEVDSNGNTLFYASKFNLSTTERRLKEYSIEPLIFNARKFNKNILSHILKEDYEINPKQIEKAVLESIINKNSEASLYLILNDKTRQIIKNSSIINLFLNNETNLFDVKKDFSNTLDMIELQKELPYNSVQQKKLKI